MVPVRKLIPIEANRGYQFACAEIQRLALECVQKKAKEMETSSGTDDIVSLIIEERENFLGTGDEMTDLEITDQVRFLSHV